MALEAGKFEDMQLLQIVVDSFTKGDNNKLQMRISNTSFQHNEPFQHGNEEGELGPPEPPSAEDRGMTSCRVSTRPLQGPPLGFKRAGSLSLAIPLGIVPKNSSGLLVE